MAYSKAVLDHFDNPRNVGSLDKTKDNVGTGLVGAPECFHGDTLFLTPLRHYISFRDALEMNRLINALSYNIKENKFEIKTAKVITTGEKELHCFTVDAREIWVTEDHEFLTHDGYVKMKDIDEHTFVKGVHVNHTVDHDEYHSGNKLITRLDVEPKVEECYTLQVEENNNYIVATDFEHDHHTGIIAKNCGDVMKLQIEVDENEKIIDAKFKTFGCGSALAASSLATEWVKEKYVDEALEIKNTQIVDILSLPPVKIHCSVLAEDAIKAAIADYRKKKEIRNNQ
jgi:NifU-like protein involved in Fe-S cluster formation